MRPIRILELRSVVGSGGGPEKTILQGTALTNREQFAITVCYLRDLRDSLYDLGERAARLGVDYVEVPERRSFDPALWKALRAVVRDRQIEVVHSHDYKTDLLAWLLGHRAGVIPLATAHGWTGHTWRERYAYYPGDKWLLARFPRVIAVSTEIRQELVRHGCPPSKITVVLNGIDPQKFQRREELRDPFRRELEVSPDAFLIGSVGRLEPQKRFDLLIEAFAGIVARHPQARLIIAGDGSLREALEAQIRGLRLGEACRLLGHQRDITKVHQALDLFVQASDYEGTSNAVLEAMAMETPVVATEAGGTAEQIQHGLHGLIVPCGSADSLRAAMLNLIEDSDQASRLSKAARRRVEGPLSFATRMRAVEQVYHDLTANARSTAVRSQRGD